MFKLLRVLVLVMASLGALSEASASVPPDQLVKETADKVLNQVQANKKELEMDTSKIYELVDQYILPHFNFMKMSRSVLGKHWLKASPGQQTNFAEAFQVLLVRTYAVALLNYSNQAIEYLPFRMTPDAKMAVVKTRVSDGASPPLPVDYLLQVEEDGNWKVVDVKIDGISLVSNYRTSFSEQVRREGLDGLIQQLKTRGGDLVQESGMAEVDQPPPGEQEAAADAAYAAEMRQNEQPAPLTEQPEQAEPPQPAEVAVQQPEAPAPKPALTETPARVQPVAPAPPQVKAEKPAVVVQQPVEMKPQAQTVKEEKPAPVALQPVETKPQTQPAKQTKPAAEPAKPIVSTDKPAAKTDAVAAQKPMATEQKPAATAAKAKADAATATAKAAPAADKTSATTTDKTAGSTTPPVPADAAAAAAAAQPKKKNVPSFIY